MQSPVKLTWKSTLLLLKVVYSESHFIPPFNKPIQIPVSDTFILITFQKKMKTDL